MSKHACSTHALTAILVLQGAASLGSLALFSSPFFRRLSYEIFLRTHQILVGLTISTGSGAIFRVTPAFLGSTSILHLESFH